MDDGVVLSDERRRRRLDGVPTLARPRAAHASTSTVGIALRTSPLLGNSRTSGRSSGSSRTIATQAAMIAGVGQAVVTKGSTPTDDVATGVPSLEWFDRWTLLLLAGAGVVIALALGLQFQVMAPFLLGPAEATIFLAIAVMLVAVVGWAYTGMKFWAQLRRGEHLTRTEQRRRARAYVLALGAAAFAVVAVFFSAYNTVWLWAYAPAAGLVALGYTMRPKRRVRKRTRRAKEAPARRIRR